MSNFYIDEGAFIDNLVVELPISDCLATKLATMIDREGLASLEPIQHVVSGDKFIECLETAIHCVELGYGIPSTYLALADGLGWSSQLWAKGWRDYLARLFSFLDVTVDSASHNYFLSFSLLKKDCLGTQ